LISQSVGIYLTFLENSPEKNNTHLRTDQKRYKYKVEERYIREDS